MIVLYFFFGRASNPIAVCTAKMCDNKCICDSRLKKNIYIFTFFFFSFFSRFFFVYQYYSLLLRYYSETCVSIFMIVTNFFLCMLPLPMRLYLYLNALFRRVFFSFIIFNSLIYSPIQWNNCVRTCMLCTDSPCCSHRSYKKIESGFLKTRLKS